MSEVVFDQELTNDDAQLTRQWLEMPAGRPFFVYIEDAIRRHHNGALNALTDNPIKDILVGQRQIAGEQALVQLIDAVTDELKANKD